MAISGFQEIAVVGSSFYFKQDNDGATEFPFIDLGTIKSISPNFEIAKATCKDGRSGRKLTVVESVTSYEEEYQLETANIADRNLALLYNSPDPAEYGQAELNYTGRAFVEPGHLASLQLSDGGDLVYGLQSISGITQTPPSAGLLGVATLVSVTAPVGATPGKVTIDTPLDANDGSTIVTGTMVALVGTHIIVNGQDLADPANAKTYLVLAVVDDGGGVYTFDVSTAGGRSSVSSSETPAAPVVGAALFSLLTGVSDLIVDELIWEVVDLNQGRLRTLSGYTLPAGRVTVAFTTSAIAGGRVIIPQSRAQQIQGTGQIVLASDAFGTTRIREARVIITPDGFDLADTEGQATLSFTAKVVVDTTNAAQPAGRLVHVTGSLPSDS